MSKKIVYSLLIMIVLVAFCIHFFWLDDILLKTLNFLIDLKASLK